jgi:uncharacterized protein (TIRG00374 family)
MQRRYTRWLMPTLRYGLCAAAILYLVHIVPWNDYVTLNDAAKTRVRLLEEHDDQLVIERNGERETVTWSDVNHAGDVPDVTYGISGVVRRTDIAKALLAILIFLPVPVLQSMRLVWMLAVQDVRLSYWNAFKLTYAGNFFNFALPGTVGGDLIKAYYVTRFTRRKTEAVTTVFLDRVIGLSGLMILASVTFLFAWKGIEWSPTYRNTLATALALVWGGLALGCVFIFSRRLRHLIKLPELAKKLPAANQLLRIGRATVAMQQHKSLVLASLLNTLVLQLFVVLAACQMAQALNMQGHFALFFIFVPLGFVLGALPFLPPMAFGVMEAAYVQFFCWGGLNPGSAAVAFALANRLTQLVWAVPGVLVPLLGAHLPSHAELRALEQPDLERPPEQSDSEDGNSSAGPTFFVPSK